MVKAHIEYMDRIERHEQDSHFGGCEWEHMFNDYDGSHVSAICGEAAEVWFCWPDWQDDMAIAMCRPHGNLALIVERKAEVYDDAEA